MAHNSRFAVATHIMTALGLDPEEPVSSSYLASSVNTNPVIVRRLLGLLQGANLVKTRAGKLGGAQLAKPAEKITLNDIYKAVDESSIFEYNPNVPNKKCPLSCVMKSVLEPVFHSSQTALSSELNKTKLSQLIDRVRKKSL